MGGGLGGSEASGLCVREAIPVTGFDMLRVKRFEVLGEWNIKTEDEPF